MNEDTGFLDYKGLELYDLLVKSYVNNSIQGLSDIYATDEELNAAVSEARQEHLDMFTWMELSNDAIQQSDNSSLITATLEGGNSSAVEALAGTTAEINIPDSARAGATVRTNLADTAQLTTSKRIILENCSDTPSDLVITATSGNPTITLKGLYGQVVTNTPITIIDGEVETVEMPSTNTNNITINTKLTNDELTINSESDKDITITGSTNENADLIINAPQATVTVNGTYDKVISTVSDNTLIIGHTTNIAKLVIKKGNVLVKDVDINNRIARIVNNTEYTITSYTTYANDWTSFNKGMTTPGITTVMSDIDVENKGIQYGVIASGNYKLNLNGHNLRFGNRNGCILVRGSVNLEISGTGSITNNYDSYGLWCSGGKVTITGGNWNASTHAVYCEKGEIEIHGGNFRLQGEDKTYLLNCLDANYTNGTAKITVYGGKFYGFNPAASMSEPGGPISFLAENKKVVEVEDNVFEVVDKY